jgi:hypothetical protein
MQRMRVADDGAAMNFLVAGRFKDSLEQAHRPAQHVQFGVRLSGHIVVTGLPRVRTTS